MYDSIIIGSSAAGLSAAIYLKRRGINFLLLGKDIGGEMAIAGEVDNYPGISHTNGLELTEKFKEQAKQYEIEPKAINVTEITKINGGFVVSGTNTENHAFEEKTKSIIIASGSKPKKLKIPGEKEYYHKGISYCSVCDGPIFKGKPVAIIGGGNSALESGLMMAELCPKVFVLTKNAEMKGDEILIKELAKKENVEIIKMAFTQEIFGEEFTKGLKYLNQNTNEIKEILVDGVFVHIGMSPNTDFVPDNWNIKNKIKLRF